MVQAWVQEFLSAPRTPSSLLETSRRRPPRRLHPSTSGRPLLGISAVASRTVSPLRASRGPGGSIAVVGSRSSQ